MKRLTSSVVSLLVSVSLALPPSTGAITDTAAASSAHEEHSVDDDVLYRATSGFVFAGHSVSWLRVMNIARDPVVDWGPAHDEQGNMLQGELWLIVARNDKFIYFHLTDTPNAAQNTTAYGGYTVKVKASMSIQFHGVGSGSVVPEIGNDTDTFIVTTTEMLVNSRFTEGEPLRFDFRTGAEIPYLVHLYDVIESYGMSTSGSRGAFAIQYFTPDGTALSEPFQQTFSAQASSSSYHPGCAAVGEEAANTFQDRVDRWEAAQDAASLVLVATAGGRIVLNGVYGEFVLQLVNTSWGAMGLVTRRVARNIVAPLTGSLAEGLCESLQNPDVLPPIEVRFTSPDLESSLVEVQLVCDEIGSEYLGSSATLDRDGGVTVTGHTEPVCTEWHYEVVS